MFFEIKIVVAGIILLTAPGMYDGNVDQKAPFESAVAVAAPKSKAGSYEIDIPAHETKLQITDMVGTTSPAIPSNEMSLDHQRVYFGKIGQNGNCDPKPTGAKLEPSAVNIPRLSLIMKTPPKLASKARPNGTDFTQMDGGPVNGWLDLPQGTLRSLHETRTDDVVEFRPSERLARLPSSVFLTADSGTIDCMVVTPFKNATGTTYKFSKKDFTVIFKNTMIANTGHVVPGAGYDFELLYDLLETKDGVPPIPYALMPTNAPAAAPGHQGEVNTQTGVNCGPPGH